MKKIIFFIACLLCCSSITLWAEPAALEVKESCQTLTCARDHIDAFNEQIVKLIVERSYYVKKAGELKGNSVPIYDAAREEEILKKVRKQAENLGYPPEIIQAIFKTLLEKSRDYETGGDKGVLRVGTTGDYPPLTYYNAKTEEFLGSDIAEALALGKNLGRKIVFVKTTWSDLSADLMADKFDIAIGGISASPERTEKFLLSKPVLTDGKVPVTPCAKIDSYNAPDKINQPSVRIVENKGGTNEIIAKQFFPKAQFILLENKLDTFNYLLTDKADVMVMDKIEALYRQKMMRDICVVNPDHPLVTIDKVYLLKKTDVQLLGQVNRWIESH